jgi:quinol monooxygenase YgiN
LTAASGPNAGAATCYGRHGLIRARPGQREALLAIRAEVARGARTMPGCRLYLVGPVIGDADAIAVTEVWDDKAAHAASLSLESVRATIAKARPFIAGLGTATEFEALAGVDDVSR